MLREAEDSTAAQQQSVPPALDIVGGMEQIHISSQQHDNNPPAAADHHQDTESMHSLDLTQVMINVL